MARETFDIHRVNVLPTSGTNGDWYILKNGDRHEIYIVQPNGTLLFNKGITNDEQSKLDQLTQEELTKLVGLDSQTITNQKIQEATAIAGAAPYPITGTVLPQTPTVTNLPDRATATVYGDTTGRTYTQTGGTNITVSINKGRTITYNKTTNLWTSGEEFSIPQIPVVNSTGMSTTEATSQKLVTDIQNSIFSNDKIIATGTPIIGRYPSNTNANPDTNSAYRRLPLIDVLPEWDIYINKAQSPNTFSWQFDKYDQPLAIITLTPEIINGVTWYKASKHPRVAKIGISGNTTDINSISILAKKSVSQSLKDTLGTNKFPTIATSQNQFTTEGLIYPFWVPINSSDGALVASNNMYITPLYDLKKTDGRIIVQNIRANNGSTGIVFYEADGKTMITNVHIPNSELQLNGFNNVFFSSTPIPSVNNLGEPKTPAFYRYWFDQRIFASSIENISKISITYSGEESSALLNNGYKNSQLYATDIKKMVTSLRKVKKDISELVVLVLGDSNTQNSNGRGSWNNMFQRLHRPKLVRVRAVAGATVTSTENLFGQQYTTGGNTLLKQCELEIKDFIDNPTTFQKPDLIIITGGTNDFDLGRYVTPATIATYPDYHQCMESLFVTNSPEFNVKKDLDTIDRSKVGGAIRYMHERFMQYFPEAIQIIATPLRSTLHNQVHAKRFVEEMVWMTERWQLPLVDVFNKGGLTTIKDFGTDRFNLADRVHVFNNDEQTRGAFIYGMYIVDEVHKLYVPNSMEKLIS